MPNNTNTIKDSEMTNQDTKKDKMIVAIDAQFLVNQGQQNPRNIYIREKTLGQGSFGTVYLVKHKVLHRYFAMKVIKKTSKKKEEEENLMNEINILKRLDQSKYFWSLSC